MLNRLAICLMLMSVHLQWEVGMFLLLPQHAI